MSTSLMISMLKQANNGNDLLSILDTICSVDSEKETVIGVQIPSAGMILDHQGREVVF